MDGGDRELRVHRAAVDALARTQPVTCISVGSHYNPPDSDLARKRYCYALNVDPAIGRFHILPVSPYSIPQLCLRYLTLERAERARACFPSNETFAKYLIEGASSVVANAKIQCSIQDPINMRLIFQSPSGRALQPVPSKSSPGPSPLVHPKDPRHSHAHLTLR